MRKTERPPEADDCLHRRQISLTKPRDEWPFFESLVRQLVFCHGDAGPRAPKKSTKKTTTKAVPAKPPRVEPAEPVVIEEPGMAPRVRAAAAIVVDANSGTVLHELNADQTRPVASTQKLLTALIIAEAGNLDEPVRGRSRRIPGPSRRCSISSRAKFMRAAGSSRSCSSKA